MPAFTEDMPVARRAPADAADGARGRAGDAGGPPTAAAAAPPEAAGRGRVAPAGARPGAAERVVRTRSSRPGSRSPSAARSDRDAASRGAERRSRALVVDVPDFPEPGVVFKDITPLLADHDGFTAVVEALAAPGATPTGRRWSTRWSGMEARGFILAAPVALALGAGFVPVRKAGKLPRGDVRACPTRWSTARRPSRCTSDALAPGDRVLLVDDVLATGGTVAATRELVERCGGAVARRSRC